MSIRITSVIRSSIASRLLAHRFDEEQKALAAHESNLAMQVYRHLYTAAERKRMNALPDGYMPLKHMFRVRIVRYDYVELRLLQPVRFPAAHLGDDVNITDAALHERVKDHLSAKVALKQARKKLEQETRAAITGFGTIARLVEAWPQVKPFVDQLGYGSEKKALPAVIPSELNSRLGL